MVAPTVDFALLVEVDQVNEELPTRGTNKALGVPAGTMPSSTGKDSNVPSTNLFSTLPRKEEQVKSFKKANTMDSVPALL